MLLDCNFFTAPMTAGSPATCDIDSELLFIDLPFLHDEGDAAQSLDVFERVALDGDDVGKHSGFEITDFVSHAKSPCWSACRVGY